MCVCAFWQEKQRAASGSPSLCSGTSYILRSNIAVLLYILFHAERCKNKENLGIHTKSRVYAAALRLR